VVAEWETKTLKEGLGALYGLALGPTIKVRPLNIKSRNKWALQLIL